MNVITYDIECYSGVYMLIAKEIGKPVWREYTVSPYENNLDAMAKWLKETPEDLWLCGFNNNSYDWQVVQYILDCHDKWYNMSNMEIVGMIRQFSNDLIDNQNYDNHKLPYYESYFDVKQIDLMSIHGFTNENKRVSLKWLEFMTDMELDETPIPFNKIDLSIEEVEEIKKYCRNDVLATEKLYEYTRGNCDNILYKGKDKIQERLDTIEEFGLKMHMINYSDVKIGEEINLIGYMKEAGITGKSALYEKKKNRKPTKQFTFGDCIPKYVQFQTDNLKKFHNRMKKVVVNLNTKEEYPVTINGLVYTIARGGLHTVNAPIILQADDKYLLKEFDVSSQYPRSLIKRELYPSHLGKSWLNNYRKLVNMRLEAKAKGKKDPKYKGVAESLKLSVNGGAFGKLNDTYSVQYDPYPHFQCTIGNQFEILMLIEWLTVEGIEILSANTDGALCKLPVDKQDKFMEICKRWEIEVNNPPGEEVLEYTDYSKYIMTTVNDYIAIKTNGELKQKGDYLTDHELNKNKSKRIVPIALREYYVNGIPVEDTVKNWPSIWEFGIAKKSSRDYYYKGTDRKTGQVQTYDKLVRYYCSKGIGEKIYKCKHEHSDKRGAKISQAESTSETQVLFNKPIDFIDIKELNIDYEWYIDRCWDIIEQLEPEKARDRKERKAGKLLLF